MSTQADAVAAWLSGDVAVLCSSLVSFFVAVLLFVWLERHARAAVVS